LAANKDDRLARWALNLSERRHYNVAAVALANKMTRVAWAMMKNETTYDANCVAA
jgi:transposase